MTSSFHTTFRSADATDTQRLVELIESAGLPAEHVGEFIGGFLVAEVESLIQACGGLEIYGDTGVLRSFVVEPRVQGSGIGRELADRQIVAAAQAGIEELYLFTGSARPFWEKFGFNETPLAAWPLPARASWQYQLVSSNQKALERFGILSMWRPVSNLQDRSNPKSRSAKHPPD